MTSFVALERLLRVLKATRTADEVRLAAVLGEIEAARRRVRQLKASIAGAGTGPAPDAPAPSAGDLDAAARWCRRLAREAHREEAAVAARVARARPLREELSRAIGRETAAGNLADQARLRARRDAERRAENAPPPRGGPDRGQEPSSSELDLSGTDSPGMA